MAAERCSAGRLAPLASALAVGAPESSDALASPASFNGCMSACYLRAIVSLKRSMTVFVAMHKYGALSMYTIGSERWNPTSYVSLVSFLVIRKATDRTSSILTHNLT